MSKLKARILHTMLRVKNLETSIKFYTEILGMSLLRKQEFEGGRFTLAFVGYGSEETNTVLELTFNWDETSGYDLGKGYGHIALGVPDIYSTCEQLRIAGARIVREPGPMKHGNTIIAFVEDPDGYQLELIER
jgi:lactoylglutathione lyase